MEALELIPAGGAIAGLLGVIGYLIRCHAVDRKQAGEVIQAANERANAAEERARAAQRAEDAARVEAREQQQRADRLTLDIERMRHPPPPPEGGGLP